MVKKIRDKISKERFVDAIRRNEERTYKGYKEKETFLKETAAAYQQITDWIERYNRIDTAIVESNANTFIDTTYGTLSVAGALSMKRRLKGAGNNRETDFEMMLYEALAKQYTDIVVDIDKANQKMEATAENMRLTILGKDSKSKEDKPLEVVNVFKEENKMELVDPLSVLDRMMKLKEKHDAYLNELEVKIKVSNATTFVEF